MKIKICGVTHPEDSRHAATMGADYIGMICSKDYKRTVSLLQAQEIAQATRENGAMPVAIFVDESAEEILSFCNTANIKSVQLHGLGSQRHLPILERHFTIFFTTKVDSLGSFVPPPILPSGSLHIFDSPHSGLGHSFDWVAFKQPHKIPWFLAGGLTPDNVNAAIQLLNPTGVDVSSSLEIQSSTRKNPSLVSAFILAVRKIKDII